MKIYRIQCFFFLDFLIFNTRAVKSLQMQQSRPNDRSPKHAPLINRQLVTSVVRCMQIKVIWRIWGDLVFSLKSHRLVYNTSSTVNRNSRTVHVCRLHVLNVRSKDKRSFMHTPLSRFVTVLQFLLIDNKTETKSNLCYANLLAVDPATQTPWKFLKVSQC